MTEGRLFEVSTHHEDSDSYRVLPADSQAKAWKSVKEFERKEGLGNRKRRY